MCRFSLTVVIFIGIFFIIFSTALVESKSTPRTNAIVKEQCRQIVKVVNNYVKVLGNGRTKAPFKKVFKAFSAMTHWIKGWIVALIKIAPTLDKPNGK